MGCTFFQRLWPTFFSSLFLFSYPQDLGTEHKSRPRPRPRHRSSILTGHHRLLELWKDTNRNIQSTVYGVSINYNKKTLGGGLICKIALLQLLRVREASLFQLQVPTGSQRRLCKQTTMGPEPSVQTALRRPTCWSPGKAAGPQARPQAAHPKLQDQVTSICASGPACESLPPGNEVGDAWLAQLLQQQWPQQQWKKPEHVHLYCWEDPGQTMKPHGMWLVVLLMEAMFLLADSASGVARLGKKR